MSAAWNRFTQVALRKESVDRNFFGVSLNCSKEVVALRKESVDRNDNLVLLWYITDVALRKESVDRNCYAVFCHFGGAVALRKESVDRNVILHTVPLHQKWSLSARRAWIEMSRLPQRRRARRVALRKESVDRNSRRSNTRTSAARRSPQGERG